MLDFSSCPEVSAQNALEAATCGWRVLWSTASAVPWIAAAVASSAVATLVLGRSLAIGVAVLLLAILVAELVLATTDPLGRHLRLAGAAVSLVLIWAGCIRYRSGLARQRSHITALETERDALQAKLDREITWRRAAEPDIDPYGGPDTDEAASLSGRPLL